MFSNDAVSHILEQAFDDLEVSSISALIERMYDPTSYDIVISIVKKGFSIGILAYDTLSGQKVMPRMYSDLFLDSPEFPELLKDNQRICIFDDAVRSGERLADVCEKIRTICTDIGITVTLDAKVIVRDEDFNPNSNQIKIDNFEDASITAGYEKMKDYAEKIIKVIYNECGSSYAVGVPRSRFVPAKSKECLDADVLAMNMCEVDDSPAKQFFNELDISLWERCLDTNELQKMFGETLGALMLHGNIELYHYGRKAKSQIITRVTLCRLAVDDLNYIIDSLINIFGSNNPVSIRCAAPELKFEWVNYILCMMLTYSAVNDKDRYRVDLSHLDMHYGKAATIFISTAEEAMYTNIASTVEKIAALFTHVSEQTYLSTTYDRSFEALMDKLFTYYNENEYNLRTCFNIQYDLLKNRTTLDLPLNNILSYLTSKVKNLEGNSLPIRKEIVNYQIAGRITVSPKHFIGENNICYVGKSSRIGECWKRSDDVHIPVKVPDVEITKTARRLNSFRQSSAKVDEEMIYELLHTWCHMEDNEVRFYLNRLKNNPLLHGLHKMFFLNGEAEFKYVPLAEEKQRELGSQNTENLIIPLSGCFLFIRVNTVLVQSRGANQKRKATLSDPIELAHHFAWFYYDCNETEQMQFNEKIDEIIHGSHPGVKERRKEDF